MNVLTFIIIFSVLDNKLADSKHVLINKLPQILLTVPTTAQTSTSTGPTTLSTTVTTVPRQTMNSIIKNGIGCGTHYMKPYEVVRIQSNNFNVGADYPNNDACTWKFFSNACTISTICPCFDVPPSFDCLQDYLKIIDLPYYHQKFCGSSVPQGVYRASTDIFSIRFRADKRTTGKGFVCFVQCTLPGYADQVTPNSTVVCPGFPNFYQ